MFQLKNLTKNDELNIIECLDKLQRSLNRPEDGYETKKSYQLDDKSAYFCCEIHDGKIRFYFTSDVEFDDTAKGIVYAEGIFN